jgi:hypothetical protein
MPISACARHVEQPPRFVDGESPKHHQFHQFDPLRFLFRQTFQGLVNRNDLIRSADRNEILLRKFNLRPVTPAFLRFLPSRSLDKQPTHSLSRGREEMAATVESGIAARPEEAEIGFVDQRSRLERLTRLLARHLGRRQFPKLVIDKRQKLIGRRRIALLQGVQELRYVGQ